MVSAAQKSLEDFTCLLLAAGAGQCVHAPECAHIEGGLGEAEVVGGLVAHHVGSAAEIFLHLRQGGEEARILCIDEANLAHQQNACIQVLAVEAFDKGFARFGPGLFQDDSSYVIRAGAPELGTVGEAEMRH